MRNKQSREDVEAVSRRKFMRMTASSAATLMAGTHFAQATTSELKPPEKVLIFGHVPQRYLKKWEITSDFEVVARKLGIQLKQPSLYLRWRAPHFYPDLYLTVSLS